MEKYTRSIEPLFAATRWITVILLSLMVILETYEISMRTFTDNTPSWTKELVLLCMVWMGCLGSAFLHRERGHIALEFIVDKMSPTVKRRVLIGGEAIVLVFSAFLLVGGITLVTEFMHQPLPGTKMPAGLSYLPLPVTGFLLCLAALEHIGVERASREEVRDET